MNYVPFLRVVARQYSSLLRNKPTNEIKVPVKMQEKIQRASKRKQIQKLSKIKKPQYSSQVVVSCKRMEYNHHKGQPYSDFNPQTLASHGWKHKRSKGDHFTINYHQSNPAVAEISEQFGDLGLNKDLVNSLEKLGITTPTNIQALAIPQIMRGGNTLMAAETGSGKTLAYLLPVLSQIRRSHALHGYKPQSKAPQGIVLLPSKELVHQVYSVGSSLCADLPLKVHYLSGGQSLDIRLSNTVIEEVDLLISTPLILRKLLGAGVYSPHCLQHIVLDEADTLLDDSFNGLVRSIFHAICPKDVKPSFAETPESLRNPALGTQVVICGATLPRSMDDIIGDFVPLDSLTRTTTDHVHHLLPHVTQTFRRLGKSEKPEAILKIAKGNLGKKIPTLIFCNKTSTCYFLHKLMEDSGVRNVMFTSGRNEQERDGKFQSFQNGDYDVMVSTDVASRGLDTLRAQHVINYDFPNFMSDYIHRAGRVGRIGCTNPGHVVSYVTHKWDVELLWQIESAARKMSELDNVNANIKRKLVSLREKKESM